MTTIRTECTHRDIESVREILVSTGFFYDYEVDIAIELVEENLAKGTEKSGYSFLFMDEGDRTIAFACFGKTPCTAASCDLYWIAVHNDYRGKGLGSQLMKLVEEQVRKQGGKNLWIETSSRPLYEPTRQFYLKEGCTIVAELPDFYGDNDHKVVFLKKLG